MIDTATIAFPPVSITPERIEEVGLNALQTQRQLFYDGWLLRVSPGTSKRARSVNPHFASRLPLAAKIDHCEALYTRCGLPVLFRITPFAQPPELARMLAARGYLPFDLSLVQTLALDSPPEMPLAAGTAQMSSRETAPPAIARAVDAVTFAEATGALRGTTASQREAHRERLILSPLDTRLVVIEVEGAVVCTAQMAIDDGIAGIFDVLTAEQVRGRGYATYTVGKLLAWAWERTVRVAYLQVTAANAPALAVYRKFGFTTLYEYRYFARPGDCW